MTSLTIDQQLNFVEIVLKFKHETFLIVLAHRMK